MPSSSSREHREQKEQDAQKQHQAWLASVAAWQQYAFATEHYRQQLYFNWHQYAAQAAAMHHHCVAQQYAEQCVAQQQYAAQQYAAQGIEAQEYGYCHSQSQLETIFWVDDPMKCRMVVDELLTESEVAVDIEGVDLCRNGRIAIIQICTRTCSVYLFDITVMREAAFDVGGLRRLLEEPRVQKVVFDGRADNDALAHLYSARMQNVFDVQILRALRFSSSADTYVKGYQKCLTEAGVVPSTKATALQQVKDRGLRLFSPEHGGSCDVWEERPLRPELREYCLADVRYLLQMKDAWTSPYFDVLVPERTEQRILAAIQGSDAATGQHMAARDFSIMYPGRPTTPPPSDDYDRECQLTFNNAYAEELSGSGDHGIK